MSVWLSTSYPLQLVGYLYYNTNMNKKCKLCNKKLNNKSVNYCHECQYKKIKIDKDKDYDIILVDENYLVLGVRCINQ